MLQFFFFGPESFFKKRPNNDILTRIRCFCTRCARNNAPKCKQQSVKKLCTPQKNRHKQHYKTAETQNVIKPSKLVIIIESNIF